MNDTLEDRLLTEQLHRIAGGAPVPATPVSDDVRRGRGRVRRRRAVATVGSAAAVVALAAGGFALTGGDSVDDRRTDEPPVADVPEAPAKELEGSRADQLELIQQVDALTGGDGERFFTLASLNAAVAVVLDRMDGDPVRWTSAARATSWHAAGADECPSGWSCDPLTVKGVTRARWAESGTVRQVVLETSGDVLVVTINSVDERPTDLAFNTD